MTINAIVADNFRDGATLAETLGYVVADNPSSCAKAVRICAQADAAALAQGFEPPFVGLIEAPSDDWRGGGQRFRLHLQSGGLGLALSTATAYGLDVAYLFCQALTSHLHDAGFTCPADLELTVHEALSNALLHGNLAVNATTSGSVEDMLRFGDLVEAALTDSALAARRVWLSAAVVGATLHVAVEDQGMGCAAEPSAERDRPHGLQLIADSVLSLRRENGGRTLLLELPLLQHRLPRQAFSQASVLIVEDNPFNRRMLEALINTMGIGRIDCAADGIEGLAAIARHRPDLVLLDVMMPNMDGHEMCRRLRADHALSDLPVLFITALDDAKSRSTCFAVGGNDVVSKPIEADEVLARVRVHLQNALLMANLNAYRNRVREELEAARVAQETLIPTPAHLAAIRARTGLVIDGVMESSSELGGDFWTLYEAGPRHLGVLAADFTGHGLAAAFNVFRLHVLLSRLPRQPPPPGRLLARLNTELKTLLKPGQFAALFAGLIDLDNDTLTYAGGATPAPLLLGDGAPRYLPVEGPPLGAFADAEFDETTVAFPPGSGLFIYSDALIESLANGVAVCDEDILPTWLGDNADDDSLVSSILNRFHAKIPGDPPDDLTLLHIRRPAAPG